MITVKVNKKDTKIKTFNELNVAEYSKLRKIEQAAGEITIIDYLSTVLNLNSDQVFNLKVKNSGFIMQSIGQAVDFKNVTPPKILNCGSKMYWLANYSIDTVGKRFFFNKKIKHLENDEQILVYCVALALSTKNDINETEQIYNELMHENYIKVLSSGWFFFLNLTNGLKHVNFSLSKFLYQIKMLVLKYRQVLKG